MEVDGRKTEEEDHVEMETLCEPCKRDDLTVSAKGLCSECDEYMCNVCFGHHLKAKACSNHFLLEQTKDNMQRTKVNVEICTKHDNEKVRFFCRKHSEVGCGDCMILEHNACKPEYIKELSRNLSSEESFKDMKKKMSLLENEANDSKQSTQYQIKESTNLLEKALEEIQNFRKLMNDYLDKAEAKVIADAKRIHSENETRMTNVAELVESVLKDIKAMYQDLAQEQHHETVLFINSVNCKPKLETIEKSLKSAKVDNFIEQFEFNADEKIAELVSSEHQLGNFSKRSSNKNSETSDSLTTSGNCDYKKWRKCDLKPLMFYVGLRVRRGPDWNAGNEDGNGLGTVTASVRYGNTLVFVDWDKGQKKGGYFVGCEGLFRIQPA